ncbi:BZ3500_MvSof-1268-A1-R1_Chr7-1g09119 [Microbotryum saponariae]|uniref:BZ3500_MvSof-1268-A1-R1_Chr7-1g09119 protein n=1 Tax=Microbotryum saponariae TaxID=289078 RepID=A0A2X0LDD4_9BASI|nr:BZ3501_MvSof-1269-A2-R1_Chr7-1g08824 [Microbotryum saponariae]SDA02838.1 BZ3500_MvSof-1268-A1-R1_Chr7-1g09119 [Microbotryum saponariae]
MSFASRPVQLPRLLSLLPRDGVNAVVYETRWAEMGIPVPTYSASKASAPPTSRWEIKKVRLDLSGPKPMGRAWGVFYWKGKRMTPDDVEYERVKGGLKYMWQSVLPPPRLVHEVRLGSKASPALDPTAPATPSS